MHLSPGLTEFQDPLHFIESLGVFEETLRQKEKALDEYTTKAQEITKHIKLKINQASEMGVPQGILDQMQLFKIDMEQYSGNLITMFDEHCKSTYVRALSKEYGIQLSTVLEGASVEEIWTFHQNGTKYRKACNDALLEKLNAHDISDNIQEELLSQFSKIPLNYNDLDLEKYNQKIEAAIRKWEIDIHVEKCEEHHEIIVPEKVEFDSKELVDEWFAESVEYRGKCEQFRDKLLDEMKKSGIMSQSYQAEEVRREPPNYGERSFEGFKAKLERLKNQKSKGFTSKKNDPFNPFELDAPTKRIEKRDSRNRYISRRPNLFLEEAMDRMKPQRGGSKPTPEATPEPLKSSPTHEDRLAELRRKSEISRQNAKAKGPSKPKVTRSPEADFERAQKEEAAARKQREQDRASKAEKKNTKKKATREDDKKVYFNELQRLEREVNRTARHQGAKASRNAQRDLDNFKKANKGKYEDDKP